MPLRDCLLAVRTLEDLPDLARELGLAPCWDEVAPAAMDPASGADVSRVAVVGRRDRFLALGLAAADPKAVARRTARALAARGQAAIVLAVDPGRRALAVSAGFADCPSLLLRPDRPRPVDIARLTRAGACAETAPAALAAHWAEALSGEELSGRFFREFRRQLRCFAEAMPRRIPAADRHAIGLLGLTRVLFLYFVQEKGWLDGRPRFLREELDRCLAGRHGVERGFLQPLFFGTLNVPPSKRSPRARRFGAVPFLNGGLFERHPLERRWKAPGSDTLWRDAFDGLFERYHFATAAATPEAIGPDMLGRVFEGVMDPAERRAGGVFYTPAALVDELVEASLTHWLALRLDVTASLARRLLQRPTAGAITAIRSIAVLDPAAGSGAFLLGALRRLVATRVAAGEDRRDATRATLAANLFGVDRNPNAVRLAELRLWLDVVAAEPSRDPAGIEPLPNLDSVVRQGDSLAEPLRFAGGVAAAPRNRLRALRGRLVRATGGSKRRLLKELRRAELDAARAALEHAIGVQERRMADARSASRTPDLFGHPGGTGRDAGDRPTGALPSSGVHHSAAAPAAVRKLLATCRVERRRLRHTLRRLRSADELPWFQFEAQFADVMARGGFDLVIGNPPWVRAEALPAAQRRELKQRFQWFRSSGGGGRYAHLPDLSVAFLERGFGLLRPAGVTGVLLPAKLMTAGYGATAREELARRGTLLALEDLTERGGRAFDATVFPMALIAARRAPAPGHRSETSLAGGRSIPQSALQRDAWRLDSEAGDARLAHAAATLRPLGDRFRVRLGVKTGCDRAFLDPPADTEPEVVRRALRGRDIRAFRATPSRRLLWPHDDRGLVLKRLPPVAARHLASHERALRRRVDYRGGAWWTLFRTGPAIARHRVVWPDLARELECAVVSSPAVVALNTTYAIGVADRDTALRLAAWLNSGWIRRLAGWRATVAASGYRRFNAAVIEALPLPDAVLHDEVLLGLARGAESGAGPDQAAIDDRCATLLGLPRPPCAAGGG